MQLVADPKAQNLALRKELLAAAARVLDSGWYILGQEVENFERDFATFCETQFAIGVANGTDALTLALLALDIGSGDEVICPSHTATFTALAISATGATPVFSDIVEATYTIDPADIERKITPRTKAIMPVHLYGHPADMDPILDLAQKHHLPVIEDVCQAHGARYKGQRVGSLGTFGCFSFYPTKNLGALGDGGAVTTNDPTLAKKVRMLRNGGQKTRYEHVLLGRNSRLDELQATLLAVKLNQLDVWNATRRQLALRYQAAFQDLPLGLPQVANWAESVFHLYVVRTADRERLMARLAEVHIQTQIHYPIPAHEQPAYRSGISLPVTDKVVGEIVSLPMYPELSPSAQDRIIAAVRTALQDERGS